MLAKVFFRSIRKSMEDMPQPEDNIPKETMHEWGLNTDESYLERNQGKPIKGVICHDKDGKPCFAYLEGENPAEGPTISGPFNPRNN